MNKCRAAVLLSMLLMPGSVLANVKITRLDEKIRFADITLSGEITAADVVAFEKTVRVLKPSVQLVTVQLNSPGGDVLAAMRIGELVRKNWLLTSVSDGTDGNPVSECDSACVLIFAAGATRFAGNSSIGIHRPYFEQKIFAGLKPDDARIKYEQLSNLVKSYLSKIGMSERLFIEMTKVPSKDVKMLTYEELKEFNLVGEDPSYAEYNRAKLVAKYGTVKMRAYDAWIARTNAFVASCQKNGESFENCAVKFREPSPLGISSK